MTTLALRGDPQDWMKDVKGASRKVGWKAGFTPTKETRVFLIGLDAIPAQTKRIHTEDSKPAGRIDARDELAKQLKDFASEYSITNWDGYGAKPIRAGCVKDALYFIERMPTWLPVPDLAPDPDGCISFDWTFGKSRALSVSFSGNGTIFYASILGDSIRKRNGVEVLNEDVIQEIVGLVNEIR